MAYRVGKRVDWPQKGDLYLWCYRDHFSVIEITGIDRVSSGRLLIRWDEYSRGGEKRYYGDLLTPRTFEYWTRVGRVR